MNTATPQPSAGTLCRHFRTKKMYVPAQAPEVFAAADAGEEINESWCWCNLTMTAAGRDDRPVAPRLCRTGRECFNR